MISFPKFAVHSLLFVLAASGLSACSKHESAAVTTADTSAVSTQSATPQMPVPSAPAVTVAKVDLGRAVGSDLSVTIPSRSFKPGDTIYAAITAEGHARNVALKLRWRYQDGSVVNTTTQIVQVSDHGVTDFHISNAAGWPPGKYSVEVMLDGKTIRTVEFTVFP